MSSFRVVLTLCLFASVGMYSQPRDKTTTTNRPELKPRRGEYGILMPERDERHDLARLVRADQFNDCERDGFPKHLAPPWKEQEEAEEKLGEARDYFIAKSVKDYPLVGQGSLQLAADRCRLNVVGVILQELVQGVRSKK